MKIDTVGTELQLRPPKFPQRRSRPRLQTFDYKGVYAYHVILTTQDSQPVFRDIPTGRRCVDDLQISSLRPEEPHDRPA